MFCKYCGTILEPDGSFCSECGGKVGFHENKNQTTLPRDKKNRVTPHAAKPVVAADLKNHVTHPGMYYLMLFVGLVPIALVISFHITQRQDMTVRQIVGLAVYLNLMSTLFLQVYIYQFWRYLLISADGTGLENKVGSPGRAVGFGFIPVYNVFHWNFVVISGFATTFNDLAQKKGFKTRMPVSPASFIPIWILLGLIPIINVFTTVVLILLLLPHFIRQGVACIKEFESEKKAK